MNRVVKWSLISLISNFILTVLQLIVGLIIKSKALVTDSMHSFSDLSTDIVGALGAYFSDKKADKKHPFGHFNIEYLTSIFIGVVIIFIGGKLLFNSFKVPTTVPNNLIGILVVIITILLKLFISSRLQKVGFEEDSSILVSSGKESFGDVLSSVVVLFVFIISNIFKDSNILKYADTFASAFISIMIIVSGLRIVFTNLSFLIGERKFDQKLTDEIKSYILNYDEVKDVSRIMIINFGTKHHVYLNLHFDEKLTVGELEPLLKKLEQNIKRQDFNITKLNFKIKSYRGK